MNQRHLRHQIENANEIKNEIERLAEHIRHEMEKMGDLELIEFLVSLSDKEVINNPKDLMT